MQYEASGAKIIHFKTEGTVPLERVPLSPGLADIVRTKLRISQLFHMQQEVLSHLLDASSKRKVGDVILCAPTGSGKTLAYALPILQSLLGRKIPRLRAIIVVPTRDLALQVGKVFRELTDGTQISVAVIIGAQAMDEEASTLKRAEILIATPGRLVDHIESDDGLVLRGIRYLVLDESDRLLQESYQSWIDSVIPVLGRASQNQKSSKPLHLRGPSAGILALAIHPNISARAIIRTSQTSSETVRKILVSATQTRNPKRLVKLGLRKPTIFEPTPTSNGDGDDVHVGYSVPSSLSEKGWVISHSQDKPLALLKILGWLDVDQEERRDESSPEAVLPYGGVKLIFTKSVESAHRLTRLLELCALRLSRKGDVLQMSGDLSPRRREEVLQIVKSASRDGAEDLGTEAVERFMVVVCSDVLSRGMDIFNVDNIINYDAPVHIRTYLHRGGRTARAGRAGTVTSLVLSKQAHHFRRMLWQAERGDRKAPVKNMKILPHERDVISSVISEGLQLLRRVIVRENLGLLSTEAALPALVMQDLWARYAGREHEPKSDDEALEAGAECGSRGDHALRTRKRNFSTIDDAEKDEQEDNELGSEQDTNSNRDDLSALLYSQITRNFLLGKQD